MTILVIRRKKEHADYLRNYRVFVDGREAGTVATGGELRVPVEPGEHEVRLQIDWCRSNSLEISIAESETPILECGSNVKFQMTLLYITLWSDNYLWLSRG